MTETWEPNKAGQLKVKRARLAARSSYFGLIGLFTGDAVLITFQGATIAVAIALWLFKVLPLSIFYPGIKNNNPRAYAWLSFAILLYFIHAVVVINVPGNLVYDLLYCGLCVAVFTTAVIYIRTARKYLGQNLMS
ncbi:hypothetical protein GCM10011403_12970 [Pseudohongiella nitratireducens]|mgnify:CR=1 FL=1|uniref:DUF2069 domain-containing protein n=1 Tax=Pseudohongiella nitratireducens TaxID=1768907 RepID=A0A917GTU8_9GAMM|nr:DUF2069 domain-containing protein [Pseudohongiella nitratireducens]MDF1623723.1 DUF2069 domain-containing protein [Pseudohongiella nitratireducens]GGG57183.1 hypothetical protein GCM10011403_12970 [Pseudohongiella nitratireducens]|tara:strand:+ start:340 stop:744 length:405 start_codon:yes stop_codon:yes gene_type:complete